MGLCSDCERLVRICPKCEKKAINAAKSGRYRRRKGIPERIDRIDSEGNVHCGKCQQWLPSNKFYHSKTRGFNGYCKQCAKEYALSRYYGGSSK